MIKPPFIILENVRNLVSHNQGETRKTIKETLENLGYIITSSPLVISPHHIGIPRIRERVIIAGYHKSSNIKTLI
ncbi:DNA cytosine methyltransferase [Mycoplasmopsis felis]|uniref:DNA cytosine methyltransferase n=1 Tax=Mycoplasmopsis felis TaxID=33923 RepID=UPI003B82C704